MAQSEFRGRNCHFTETVKYTDGGFLNGLFNIGPKYNVRFSAVVEEELGENFKIIISDADLEQKRWVSIAWMQGKKKALRDAQEKIGKTLVKPKAVVTLT